MTKLFEPEVLACIPPKEIPMVQRAVGNEQNLLGLSRPGLYWLWGCFDHGLPSVAIFGHPLRDLVLVAKVQFGDE